MVDLSIARIERQIRAQAPVEYVTGAAVREAAVAAVLRDRGEGTEALFIRRAEKVGDPWSGHMAFPGGHRDSGENLEQTAIRETMEELSVDLEEHARLLGPLQQVRPNIRSPNLGMVVAPFVFALEREVEITPNHEVADYHWAPLDPMYSGEVLIHREFQMQGETRNVPGFGIDGEIIWGLTYRVVGQFFNLLDPDWVPLDY